ncbi:hypothetical protein BKA56DRAFT_605466 [Ilyonectria sp. MPI-CAGE-AT-0026]|nr:hypothetical protein BKA56DRAFT_605466 [Ilyonectria sp. MPI-CAGE-AT-0026]
MSVLPCCWSSAELFKYRQGECTKCIFATGPINRLAGSNYPLRFFVCHTLACCLCTLDHNRYFMFTPAAEMASVESILATCFFGLDLFLNLCQLLFINRTTDSRKPFYIWLLRLILGTATGAVPLGMLWQEHRIHREHTLQEVRRATLVINGTLWWNTVTEGLFYYCSVFPVFSKYPWTVVSFCISSFVLLAANWILFLTHPGVWYQRLLVAVGHVILKLSLVVPWPMFTYKAASAEIMKLAFTGFGLLGALVLSFVLGFVTLPWPSGSDVGFNQVFYDSFSTFLPS